MASPYGWRCLNCSRGSQVIVTISRACPSSSVRDARSFTTTVTRDATAQQKSFNFAQKKADSSNDPVRKNFRLKRGAPAAKVGRPIEPGERKAMRKKIVLSNPNALEVRGVEPLRFDQASSETQLRRMVGLPGQVVDELRALEAFKTTQAWPWFRSPSMLVREETVELGKRLEAAKDGEALRMVYTGNKGVGKSLMLLQAMAMARLGGWIVISIPEGQELTMAHTAFTPFGGTNSTQYIQKDYTAALLERIRKANQATLSKLQVSMKHDLPMPLQSNISLDRLAALGAHDPDIAWPIFQALWKELIAKTSKTVSRPPILISIDHLGHLMKMSEYRDPDFNFVHSHDLVLVDHLIQYLSGQRKLPNGGAVIAATSASNAPLSTSFFLAIAQGEAKAAGTDMPQPSGLDKLDQRVRDSLKDVEVKRLHGLSLEETKVLMEFYASSGLARDRIDDRFVGEKWTIASGGIPAEIERAVMGSRK